ncbi:MAG: hypothetical protein A2Y38_04230 [Spirochaetes bacterium GWB1_59_5]|nr:MAG: hypothetical protein A2Y38_04230 [Spirochaetes bacterium GWB1_59_5]
MAKTQIRNKDVALDAGILTDKCNASGQNNQFLDPTQLTELTTGVNADGQHWHSAFGAISAQFGRNALVGPGQFIEASGVPTSLTGILMARDGQVLSVGIALSENAVGSDCVVEILTDIGVLTSVTIPVGSRKARAINLSANFTEWQELKCRVSQGQARCPSVLVEFRWR